MAAPEGNQNAVKRSRLVGDTLRKVAVQNPEKLRKACETLLDKMVEGDISAFKEFRDTLDGKPAQVIVGGDDDDNPVKTVNEIVIRGVDSD